VKPAERDFDQTANLLKSLRIPASHQIVGNFWQHLRSPCDPE